MSDAPSMARKGGSGEDWMTTTTTAAGLLLGWMGRRDASEWDSAREGMEEMAFKRKRKALSVADDQACELKFRLRELNSCLCSAAALADRFEGRIV